MKQYIIFFIKQWKPSLVIVRNEVTKQSSTDCHSEPCPESKRRNGEESQRDCFAGICGSDQEGG